MRGPRIPSPQNTFKKIVARIHSAGTHLLFPTPQHIRTLEDSTYADLVARFPKAVDAPYPFVRPVFVYRNEYIRKAVFHIKYRGNTALVDVFGETLLYETLSLLEEDPPASFPVHIVPIPLSQARFTERGFNQSALLARSVISKDTSGSLSYSPFLLERVKNTLPQTKLKKRERRRNVVNSFFVPNKYRRELQRATVILVDDVTTTGSTLKDARRALIEAGAHEVKAVTLAH